jgi:hypothetical protein
MISSSKLIFSLLLLNAPVWADSIAELDYAVSQVLEQQGALFVSYDIDQSGRLSVLFGANEPDWRVNKTVKALQSRPDIPPGFFWARTDAEFCAIR